jgi:hypothetical protein
MKPSAAFLETLELAANRSAQAESDIRREWAERIKTLERERAFAHRRFNFMRAIAEAVATAESEEIAVAAATAAMLAKLGWWRCANRSAFAFRAGRATGLCRLCTGSSRGGAAS